VYNSALQKQANTLVKTYKIKDAGFQERLTANLDDIHNHFRAIYGDSPLFTDLIQTIFQAFTDRSPELKKRDEAKAKKEENWFLSQDLVGMSLYVDRFAGKITDLPSKLSYLEKLGVNFLHLMPLFKSPEGESDGGYAVEDFRVVEEKLGTIEDLREFQQALQQKEMYLMIDIVLNHTSHHHEWAKLAKAGIKEYQDYFYMYDDRRIPDAMEETMPEIFPESSPGSFTYDEKMDKPMGFELYEPQSLRGNARKRVLLRELRRGCGTHRCAGFHLETNGNVLPKPTRSPSIIAINQNVCGSRNARNGHFRRGDCGSSADYGIFWHRSFRDTRM
jgi:amylosucrase